MLQKTARAGPVRLRLGRLRSRARAIRPPNDPAHPPRSLGLRRAVFSASSASDGSHFATDSSRSGEPSATYGGLLTITSNCSPLEQRVEPRSAGSRFYVAARPIPVKFAAATANALSLTSVIQTVVLRAAALPPATLRSHLTRFEIGDQPRWPDRRRTRSPPRRRARSRGSALADPASRAGGSSTARARTVQRLTRPVAGDHRVEVGDHPLGRLLVEAAMNSSPSSAVATSHNQRASLRAPTASAVCAQSSRIVIE